MARDYASLDDLAESVEDEGLSYHIRDYIDWADITVAGVPLPPEIVAAAKQVEAGLDLIGAWLPDV